MRERGSPSGVDILVHLPRGRVRGGQRELHAALDLGLHVRLDAVEDGLLGELLLHEPRGQRLERVAVGHPVPLLVAGAVLPVHVAHVVAVVPVGLALEEGGALAAARPLDEALHGGVHRLHVLAVHALGVHAHRAGAGQDLARDRLVAGGVLAVEIVLADVDDGQLPERGHVHGLVEQALPERAVAEEAHRDLAALAHLGGERGAGGEARGAPHDGVGAEIARLGIGDVHGTALAPAVARLLTEELGEHPAHRGALGQAVAVAAMRARDEVVPLERLADPDRDRLLADIEMGQAGHLRALVELVHLLLEGADLGHLPVHVEVLLQVHPRLGHLGAHLGPPLGYGSVAGVYIGPARLAEAVLRSRRWRPKPSPFDRTASPSPAPWRACSATSCSGGWRTSRPRPSSRWTTRARPSTTRGIGSARWPGPTCPAACRWICPTTPTRGGWKRPGRPSPRGRPRCTRRPSAPTASSCRWISSSGGRAASA